jgi:hypothetical protein
MKRPSGAAVTLACGILLSLPHVCLGQTAQWTASRMEQLYQKRWKSVPMLVDVVETVNWSGANTSWSDAGQGDILISNSPQGTVAFEVLFHEASHLLMDRGSN